MNRHVLIGGAVTLGLLAALSLSLYAPGKAPATDEGLRAVTFVTDWKAQAEHGGFYQALAKGYYADEGLAVTIPRVGPALMCRSFWQPTVFTSPWGPTVLFPSTLLQRAQAPKL